MPRLQPFYGDTFCTLLTEDVEELLARFQQTDSVRYQDFSAIWREMCFSDVFLGVHRAFELKRFCRITLATGLKFFLPPYSYQIRVGGLYLMFAFYHTQLTFPPVQIRLPLRDWPAVQKFLRDSVDSGHHDVVYIYRKLVQVKAIHYTAMPHFLFFQKHRKAKKEQVCAEFLGRTTAVQDLLSAEILEELTNIQSRYENLKQAVAEVKGQATMTSVDLSERMKDCMTEFTSWQEKTFSQAKEDKNSEIEDDKEKGDQESSSRRAKLLSSIKQKSYKNFQQASKSRRHRQAEVVDSSSSGTEPTQEATAATTTRKPPSLRARTWKSLGVTKEEDRLQAWLLSAPEQPEKVPLKRTNPQPLYRP